MANSCRGFLTAGLFRNPVFALCLGVYLLFRLVLLLQPALVPFLLQHYLADFLCLPVVLTLTTLIQQQLIQKNPAYRLNQWQVIFAIVYFSFLFELVFPLVYARYTADVWDAFAYAAGGFVYWKYINPAAAPTPA